MSILTVPLAAVERCDWGSNSTLVLEEGTVSGFESTSSSLVDDEVETGSREWDGGTEGAGSVLGFGVGLSLEFLGANLLVLAGALTGTSRSSRSIMSAIFSPTAVSKGIIFAVLFRLDYGICPFSSPCVL